MREKTFNMVVVCTGLHTLEEFRINADIDACNHGMSIISRSATKTESGWHMAIGAAFEGMILNCRRCGNNALSEEGGDAFIHLPDNHAEYRIEGAISETSGAFEHYVSPAARSEERESEARITSVSCMTCIESSTGELIRDYYDTGTILRPLARQVAGLP